MAVKNNKDKKDYEQESKHFQAKYNKLKLAVELYITGVDELFKGKPTNREVGQVLARLVADLEKNLH
jgi:hypothetical protein